MTAAPTKPPAALCLAELAGLAEMAVADPSWAWFEAIPKMAGPDPDLPKLVEAMDWADAFVEAVAADPGLAEALARLDRTIAAAIRSSAERSAAEGLDGTLARLKALVEGAPTQAGRG
jgi:hypothetical protein